jgi:hypothetical protein
VPRLGIYSTARLDIEDQRRPLVRMIAALCGLAVLALVGVAQAESVDMNPGEWEITTTVKMEGMPELPGMPGEMPPQVTKQCLTEEDIVPKPNQEAEEECTVTDQKVTGNTVEWSLTCEGEGMTGTGNGTATWSGDTLDGTFEMKMQMPGQGDVTMKSTLKGKRLGPCKE